LPTSAAVTYFGVSSYVDHGSIGGTLATRIVLRCWISPADLAVLVMRALRRISRSSQIARTAKRCLASESSRQERDRKGWRENPAAVLKDAFRPADMGEGDVGDLATLMVSLTAQEE